MPFPEVQEINEKGGGIMAIYYQQERLDIQNVLKLNDAVNQKRVDLIDPLLASGYHFYPFRMAPPSTSPSLDKTSTLNMFRDIFNAYPDWHEEIVHIFAYGTWIGAFYIISGTFTRPYRNHPPTNRYFETQTSVRARFSKYGKQLEAWGYYDRLSEFQQTGVIP